MVFINSLKDADIFFFVGCAVVVALIVLIYFLMPVFKKKLYSEQRENLKKREAAFKNLSQETSNTISATSQQINENIVDDEK